MCRSSFAIIAVLVLTSAIPCAATQLPVPHASSSPKMTKVPGLSNKVRVPKSSTAVSAAACTSRAAVLKTPADALGPNGASKSQTLVAVPIGGGKTTSATREAQISEACAHQRR